MMLCPEPRRRRQAGQYHVFVTLICRSMGEIILHSLQNMPSILIGHTRDYVCTLFEVGKLCKRL